MSQRQQPAEKSEKKRLDFGSLIMLGLVFGAGIGIVIFEDAGVGAGAGLLMATIVNAYYEWKERAKGAGVALVISLVALVAFVGILIVR